MYPNDTYLRTYVYIYVYVRKNKRGRWVSHNKHNTQTERKQAGKKERKYPSQPINKRNDPKKKQPASPKERSLPTIYLNPSFKNKNKKKTFTTTNHTSPSSPTIPRNPPNHQSSPPNNPLNRLQNPIFRKIHIIQIKMLPITPHLLQTHLRAIRSICIRLQERSRPGRNEIHRAPPLNPRRLPRPTHWKHLSHLFQHLLPGHTHKIHRRKLLVLSVEQPNRRTVRLPPKSM